MNPIVLVWSWRWVEQGNTPPGCVLDGVLSFWWRWADLNRRHRDYEYQRALVWFALMRQTRHFAVWRFPIYALSCGQPAVKK
jgi:hypothetical protein